METAQAAAGLALGPIGQIALTVKDAAQSLAFYRDALGLKFLFDAPNLAFFDCGGVRLMLSSTPEPGKYSSVVYFKVNDIERAQRILSGRGVLFEGAPHLVAKMSDHDLWMAFFRDPDRNLLALMSEVPKDA
jgi:methylmalonyl-CoA/ethylmalonyl-CoA epimerase